MKLLIKPKLRDINLRGYPEVKHAPSGDYQRFTKIQRYVKHKGGSVYYFSVKEKLGIKTKKKTTKKKTTKKKKPKSIWDMTLEDL